MKRNATESNVARSSARLENTFMEESVARLASDVAHIRSDVGEIKTDMRELRGEIGSVRNALASAKIWVLLIAATVLGVLARGFGWL